MDPIQATFEHGVFRPIAPVVLPEGCQVEIRVLPVGDDQAQPLLCEKNAGISIEDQLRTIAGAVSQETWRQLPVDLSDRIDYYVYRGDAE